MYKFPMSVNAKSVFSTFHGGREKTRAIQRSTKLGVQRLEDRINPVSVTTNLDLDFVDNDSGSLRDAIEAINEGTGIFGEIDFSSDKFFSGANPIVLSKALPELEKNTTITGEFDNSFVRIEGGGDSVFRTSVGKTITISNMTIQNAGGFQFVDSTVSVSNVVFKNTSSLTNLSLIHI